MVGEARDQWEHSVSRNQVLEESGRVEDRAGEQRRQWFDAWHDGAGGGSGLDA